MWGLWYLALFSFSARAMMRRGGPLLTPAHHRPLQRLSLLASPAATAAGDDWYKKGLAFKCTLCGNCCSGTSGTVRFTEPEAEAMARKLSVPLADFYADYTRKRGKGQTARVELKEVRGPDGRGWDCVFLDRTTMPGKAICGLYQERPAQCKTWPFWPEILESPESWAEAKLGAEGCPGVGKGAVVPYVDIVRMRDATGP